MEPAMWRKASYLRSASFAAISTLPVILGCALLSTTGARADTCTNDPSGCEPFVVTFQQEGANIVATGTGEFDTTGLMPSSNFGIIVRGQIAPSVGQVLLGASSGLPGFNVSGPTDISFSGLAGLTRPTTGATSTSGPALGVNGGIPGLSPQSFLSLPAGYMSGAIITSEAIFPAASISCATTVSPCDGLGMQPDTMFTWTWGNAPDQSFTVNTALLAPPSEIPAPAALPLFATGLGALGLLGWRRKRRAQAVA
jgi:hypothetical protein